MWRYKNQRWSEALNRKKINKNGKVGFEVVVGDYDFDHLKKKENSKPLTMVDVAKCIRLRIILLPNLVSRFFF